MLRPYLLLIGLRTCRRCYLANEKKIKLKNLCVLFPAILIFIVVIDRNITNNKNSVMIPQYNHKFLLAARGQFIKTDICDLSAQNQSYVTIFKCRV